MRVSFTGTRRGMSPEQKKALREFLTKYKPEITAFSHGCCAGADIEAHQIVREVLGQKVHISVFPSTAQTRAAIPQDADYIHDRLDPLERNSLIVEAGEVLFAAPFQDSQIRRSGTWATVRCARRQCKLVMVAPRGSITE